MTPVVAEGRHGNWAAEMKADEPLQLHFVRWENLACSDQVLFPEFSQHAKHTWDA